MRMVFTCLQRALYYFLLLFAIHSFVSGCKKNDNQSTSETAITKAVNSTSTEKIAFQTNRDGNFEIYLMNADGTAPTRLTNNPAWDTDPAWSPDRSKIVFESNRDGNWNIFVMNADGSNVQRLTSDPGDDTHPEWSPDGSKILFGSNRLTTNWGSRVGGIYTMNADGSNVTALIPPSGDYTPDWSPDGKKIVFASLREGAEIYPTHDIWTMNADGSALTRLTDKDDGFDGYPQWSPDGSRILYVHDGIRIMNANGSGKKQIGAGNSPTWSPNGQQIAFLDTRDGGPCCVDGVYNVELYAMNADGSGVKRLTNNPAYDQGPAWSR